MFKSSKLACLQSPYTYIICCLIVNVNTFFEFFYFYYLESFYQELTNWRWFAFLLLYSEWLSNHCTREILNQAATNVYFIFFNVVMVSCLCSVANLVYNYIILRLKVTVNTFFRNFLNIFKSKKIRGSAPPILQYPPLL